MGLIERWGKGLAGLGSATANVVNGMLVDHLKPKLTGLIGQLLVIAGLLIALR